MRRSRISQLIQMGSIGISDTAPVDSPCHPEDLAANLANVKRGLKVADEYGYPMYRVICPLWATAALAARGPAPGVLEQLCGDIDPGEICFRGNFPRSARG